MLEQCDFMELTEEDMSLLMPSTIRKCLDFINEMVSSSCFRQMRKNGLFCITKVKRQQLR